MEAFQAPGIVGVCDTLLNCLTFKLGEYNADIQHGPAHRGRSIKLFRGGYKLHIVLLKQLHHRCKVQNGAAYPIQLIHDDPPDLSPADLAQQLLKLRSVRILTGIAFVLEYPAATTFQFILAKVNLTFNADTVLAVY